MLPTTTTNERPRGAFGLVTPASSRARLRIRKLRLLDSRPPFTPRKESAPFLGHSNRYTKLLESLVSYTKKTVYTNSNRYKKRFSPRRSLPALVGPERSHRSEGLRSTPLAVALVLNGAAAKRAREVLIANEMHSRRVATTSKRATYDFVIANEFQFASRSRLSHV